MTPHQLKTLRSRIHGQVTGAKDLRELLACDAGILTQTPSAVLYPTTTTDLTAIVEYAHDQAQGGKAIGLTARGNGSDTTGSALGSGAVVVFPAHMHRLKRLSKDSVTVQPGMRLGALQSLLRSHGRYLPQGEGMAYNLTVGGLVAGNASGETAVRYGAIGQAVKGLKVVLDDGSVIETRRMSRWDVGRKKGLMTREGDLYRGIDGLLQDHATLVKDTLPQTSVNAAGYQLNAVKGRDGSIDLTSLFVGSQGTLGLISEITLKTEVYESHTTVVVGYFNAVDKLGEAVLKLSKLSPRSLEMIDTTLVAYMRHHHANTTEGLVSDEPFAAMLIVSFNNRSHLRQNMQGRKAERILGKFAASQKTFTQAGTQERLMNLSRLAANLQQGQGGAKRALPLLDAAVPVRLIPEFLAESAKLLQKHKLETTLWGHAGSGAFYLQPQLDLAKKKDRKTVFAVMDDFYIAVIKLGGTVAGSGGGGILKAQYLERQYGKEMVQLFKEVKELCDPLGLFNPAITATLNKKDLEPLLRNDFSVHHLT